MKEGNGFPFFMYCIFFNNTEDFMKKLSFLFAVLLALSSAVPAYAEGTDDGVITEMPTVIEETASDTTDETDEETSAPAEPGQVEEETDGDAVDETTSEDILPVDEPVYEPVEDVVIEDTTIYGVQTYSTSAADTANIWEYHVDENEKLAFLNGINPDVVDTLSEVYIPSEINGYPVSFVSDYVFEQLPADVTIYNANVYSFDIPNEHYRDRLVDATIAYTDNNGIQYRLFDGLASVVGYEPHAIRNGNLSIPSFVVAPLGNADGSTSDVSHDVVSINRNALSPLSMIGFDEEGRWNGQEGIDSWSDEVDRALDPYLYGSLDLPFTVKYIDYGAIGGKGFRPDDALHSISIPKHSDLFLHTEAILNCTNLQWLNNVPPFGTDGVRYTLYGENGNGAMLYDSLNNTVFTYTHGTQNTDFTVDIYDVQVADQAFAYSNNLRTATITSFREIRNGAFWNCENLVTLYLNASDAGTQSVKMMGSIRNNSRKLMDIYISGQVDELQNMIFEEACNCLNVASEHQKNGHHYAYGELMVHLDGDFLPNVSIDPNYAGRMFLNTTIVCPDNLADVYRDGNNQPIGTLLDLNVYEVITESEYTETVSPYAWNYYIDDTYGTINISGVNMRHTFDPQYHELYIPSELPDLQGHGHPVVKTVWATFDGVPWETRIYDTNVYNLVVDDPTDAGRIRGEKDVNGAFFCWYENINYYVSDGLAAVVSYSPEAIDENGTLTVPATITVDGEDYDVVSTWMNALSPYRAAGFDENDWCGDLYLHDWSDEVNNHLEPFYYTRLELPDTIKMIGERSIGDHFDNNRLESIKLPDNPDFYELHDYALLFLPNLVDISGLPNYDDRDDEAYGGYRYFEYTPAGTSASVIYDRLENKIVRYTSGSDCKEFTVDIPDVFVVGETFSSSYNLEKVTITSFSSLGHNIFANCSNLLEITLTASDNPDCRDVYISHNLTSGTSLLRKVSLLGDIDRINQYIFEDWCDCQNHGDQHDPNRHSNYDPGELMVYFDDPTPPEVADHRDNPLPLYDIVTVVVPDEYLDTYRNTGNLHDINYHDIISASTFDSFSKYSWDYYQDGEQIVLTNVRLYPDFDNATDYIVIPSEIDGYPVTRMEGDTIWRTISPEIQVYSTNVFAMQFDWEQDRDRVNNTLLEGSRYYEDDRFSYYISDGMAAITGYKPAAIEIRTDDNTGEQIDRIISLPEDVMVDGTVYPVVSVYPHALSVPFNMGYTNDQEWNDATGHMNDEEWGEFYMTNLDPYIYHSLIFSDSIILIAPEAYAGEHWYHNNELERVIFPNNDRLVMSPHSNLNATRIIEYFGLPNFGEEGASPEDGANYSIYRNDNGAMGLYDRYANGFFGYTNGHKAIEFCVDIHGVDIMDGAFNGAHNLEKLTIRQFRRLGGAAINCENLSSLELEAVDDAELSGNVFCGSPNLREIHIPHNVTRIAQDIFADWCDCLQEDQNWHDAGNHRIERGGLRAYFYSDNPPEVININDNNLLYDYVTIVCPAGSKAKYEEVLKPLNYFGHIETHSEQILYTISEVRGRPGDYVEVDVHVNTNGNRVTSLSLSHLQFNEEMLEFTGFIYAGISDNAELVTMDNEKRNVIIGFQNGNFESVGKTFDNELVCRIGFRIKADTNHMSSPVNFEAVRALHNQDEFAAGLQCGYVHFDYLKGDINMDGTVDIRDALALLQFSIMPDYYPIPYPDNIDFYHDGNVDIEDARYLFNYSMVPGDYPLD